MDSDLTVTNSSMPNNFSSATFNQIVFVNGNLTINADVVISDLSTLLFVVKGNVNIAKSAKEVNFGALVDGDISTAYNVNEGDLTATLVLKGLYLANKFNFQRTLQGTDNSTTPSEDFAFEPKYLIQLRDLYETSSVKWESIQ